MSNVSTTGSTHINNQHIAGNDGSAEVKDLANTTEPTTQKNANTKQEITPKYSPEFVKQLWSKVTSLKNSLIDSLTRSLDNLKAMFSKLELSMFARKVNSEERMELENMDRKTTSTATPTDPDTTK